MWHAGGLIELFVNIMWVVIDSGTCATALLGIFIPLHSYKYNLILLSQFHECSLAVQAQRITISIGGVSHIKWNAFRGFYRVTSEKMAPYRFGS